MNENEKIKVYSVSVIMEHLDKCIQNKDPFSLIRFGDGGLKFIHSLVFNDDRQLEIILRKEGIPRSNMIEIFEKWGYYVRKADYIDTPQVYFSKTFWPRYRKNFKPMNPSTISKLKNWKDLYNRAEFDNDNYCNPEINYLSIIKRENKVNLFDVMKSRKICCITAVPECMDSFINLEVDIVQIVKQYQNHYLNSYHDVVRIIKKAATNYDLWLVAAGEIGRIYSGLIKEYGGRSFDIGFVAEYWKDYDIPIRLSYFLKPDYKNKTQLIFTKLGEPYEELI